MGAKDPLNMRTFLTLCLVAAAMAQGGVPHLPSYGEPNTVYCYHREDPTDHKCYEACATTDFNSTGITQPGTCNPAVFKITETTKKVNACSDGVTIRHDCPREQLRARHRDFPWRPLPRGHNPWRQRLALLEVRGMEVLSTCAARVEIRSL